MIGSIAIALAALAAVAPASLAQDQGKPAGPVSVAVPSGGVSVSPESVDGEPVYVRRTSPIGGLVIVEVSKTPFMPVVPASGEAAPAQQFVGRADAQPAGW